MPHVAGDPVILSARIQNALEDVAHERLAGNKAAGSRPSVQHAVTIRAKNSTGSDLERFKIAQLSAEVVSVDATAQGKRDPTMTLVDPTWPDVCGTYAVLAEPIPDGKFGRVVISGVCVVEVFQVSAADRRAAPDPTTPTRLRSCDTGSVRMIGSGTSTGVVRRLAEVTNNPSVLWGYVRTQDAMDGPEVRLYRLDGAAPFADGSGLVDLADERGFTLDQEQDDTGICVQTDAVFRALQAVC